MQRIGFLLKVKSDCLEEYKQRHREAWPEMLAALKECGWCNYSLFLRQDGQLFGYLETEDFDKALAAMGKYEVNTRWQESMAHLFEDLEGQNPDETLLVLEEVFHQD